MRVTHDVDYKVYELTEKEIEALSDGQEVCFFYAGSTIMVYIIPMDKDKAITNTGFSKIAKGITLAKLPGGHLERLDR